MWVARPSAVQETKPLNRIERREAAAENAETESYLFPSVSARTRRPGKRSPPILVTWRELRHSAFGEL